MDAKESAEAEACDGYELLDPRAGQLWLWKLPKKPSSSITIGPAAPRRSRYLEVNPSLEAQFAKALELSAHVSMRFTVSCLPVLLIEH
jgi:hypothetical protein